RKAPSLARQSLIVSSSLAVITADPFAALTSPVWPLSRATWGPLLHVADDRCVVDAAMVQASTQDKGAASTDLTAESGAAPAQTLAADWPAPTVSKPTAERDQAERTDREALALAQLYALYLSARRSHNTAIATVMATATVMALAAQLRRLRRLVCVGRLTWQGSFARGLHKLRANQPPPRNSQIDAGGGEPVFRDHHPPP